MLYMDQRSGLQYLLNLVDTPGVPRVHFVCLFVDTPSVPRIKFVCFLVGTPGVPRIQFVCFLVGTPGGVPREARARVAVYDRRAGGRAGHVDFSYEVARSLRACQGALFLVDASQGVQAQTVANHNAARDAGLVIVPCLTKIDLAVADPEPCLVQMATLFGAPTPRCRVVAGRA